MVLYFCNSSWWCIRKGYFIKLNGCIYYTACRSAFSSWNILPIPSCSNIKTAQGSSTVAITTTAGIIAPLLGALGLASPVKTVLCVMAIGAGAMTVSHANDSYFWVVTNFGDMDPEQGYKTQTVCTLIMGIAAMVEIFILSLIL